MCLGLLLSVAPMAAVPEIAGGETLTGLRPTVMRRAAMRRGGRRRTGGASGPVPHGRHDSEHSRDAHMNDERLELPNPGPDPHLSGERLVRETVGGGSADVGRRETCLPLELPPDAVPVEGGCGWRPS
jgi:hypothetical protein